MTPVASEETEVYKQELEIYQMEAGMEKRETQVRRRDRNKYMPGKPDRVSVTPRERVDKIQRIINESNHCLL